MKGTVNGYRPLTPTDASTDCVTGARGGATVDQHDVHCNTDDAISICRLAFPRPFPGIVRTIRTP